MNHLMVDLETMGNGPYAPVISIGAVFFDPNTGETGEEFSVNISLESSMRYRARPDASTILWWLEQSEEARKSLTSNTQELSTALSWLMVLSRQLTGCRYQNRRRRLTVVNLQLAVKGE